MLYVELFSQEMIKKEKGGEEQATDQLMRLPALKNAQN